MVFAGLCVILLVVWTLFAYSAIPLPINDALFAWVRRQWLVEGTAVLVASGWLALSWARRRDPPADPPWQGRWWLWIGVAACSMAYSIDRGASLRGILALLSYGLLACLMARLAATERDLALWAGFLVGAALVASVEGLLQYCGSFQTTLQLVERLQAAGQLDIHGWNLAVFKDFLARKRIFSVFGWPNLYAGFLLLMIPLAAGLALHARRTLPRWGWALAAGWLGVSLVLTLSMGAWIAGILAAGVIMWWSRRASMASSAARAATGRLAQAALLCGVLVIALWVAAFIAAKRARPFILSSTHSRIVYVQGAANIIREHPLRGTGFGTFAPAYRALMPREDSEGQHTAIHAHNTLLQVAAELGVIGLGVFLWWLVAIAGLVRRSLAGGLAPSHAVRWGLAAGVAAFFMHSLLEQTFVEGVTAPFWWIAVGLLSAAAAAPQPVAAGAASVRGRRLLRVAVSCGLLAAAGRMGVADACAALAGFKAFEGRQEEALAAFDAAQRWDPLAARYPFEQGQRLLQWAGQQPQQRALLLEQARQRFERTVALSPWQGSGWLHLGLVREQLGRLDEALAALRLAVRYDPNSRAAALRLAQLLGATGRFEEMAPSARRYQQLAPADGQGWFLEALALQQLGQTAEATQAYRALVQRDPAHFAAWFNLAELLRKAGDRLGAAAAYRAFLDVAPGDQQQPRAAAAAFLQEPLP